MAVRRTLAVAGCAFACALAGTAAASSDVHIGSRVYGTRDGLPAGRVHAIAQDQRGFLWLGMSSGLVRFDGFAFVPWGSRNEPALLSQDIRALLVARDGALWVGYCAGGGVARIRGDDVVQFTARDGLACVQTLAQDQDGSVWAGARGGLARFRSDHWEFVPAEDGLPQVSPRVLLADRRGGLWVGIGAGLFHRDRTSTKFERLSETPVLSLVEDTDGSVMMLDATPASTITRIDPSGSRRVPLALVAAKQGFLRDHVGAYWYGTASGLFRIAQSGERHQLSLHQVLALFEDRDGDVWAGTTDGLIRLFESAVQVINPFPPDTGQSVLVVETTPDGTVWLGTTTGLYAVRGDSEHGFAIDHTLPGQAINAASTDATGQLWLATLEGIGTYSAGRIALLPGSAAVSGFAVAKDGNGDLWTCRGADQMAYRWHAGVVTPLATGSDSHSNVCVQLQVDRQGRVWFGFADGTIAMRDRDGRPTFFRQGVTPSTTCGMHEDEAGTMWLATTAGLRRLRGDSTITVTDANGLPSAFLTGLVADDEGFLWLAFKSGIVRLARSEVDKVARDPGYRVQYEHYDLSDGLPVPAMCLNRPMAARRNDGTLWFVTESGVAMVNPKSLSTGRTIPPIQIERITADARTSTSLDRLELPPQTSRLRFEYTVPSFSSASKLRFQFRLDGVDHHWIQAGTARQAEYTNLAPGPYRFHVVASLNGVQQSAAEWDFAVRPFFHQTWWFYALCGVVASGALAAAWQLRVRALRRQFAAVADERTRIARELHDTILQSMAGIVLKLEGLAMDAADSTATSLRGVLREIEYHMEDARDSIWNLRAAPLVSRTLLAAIEESASRLTVDYPGKCDVRVRGDVRACPKETEEELLRIAQEAIRNAVRHGTFQHLVVELVYESDAVRLLVTDDGRGFDVSKIATGSLQHWGLRGVSERAARIGGRVHVSSIPGVGTQIETVVPSHT